MSDRWLSCTIIATNSIDPVVVVGAGAAAQAAVIGLRRAGFDGRVVMVGREPHPPYQRPPLSKRYLVGDLPRSAIFFPTPDAELRLGVEVVEIDPDRHHVRLDTDEQLTYGRLLLAPGARPRRLAGYEDRHHLRELDDADRLRALLEAGVKLHIVGAGFIGCEVAAGARARGLEVVVYESLEQPLVRVLGAEVGAWLAEVHRSHGVDLRTGLSALPPLPPETLVAVGAEPNQELAAAAGIDCRNGILVDELSRTNLPDVYAAGDGTRFWSPLYEAAIRVEHFQTAIRHGEATGRSIAGQGRPFAEAPWFWSDQYDLNLQYVGGALPWDATLVRGRMGEPPFTVLYLREGRLVAAAGVNDARTIGQLRRLIEARVEVDPEQLADPAIDLKGLAPPR